jgi:hypothetical protein
VIASDVLLEAKSIGPKELEYWVSAKDPKDFDSKKILSKRRSSLRLRS